MKLVTLYVDSGEAARDNLRLREAGVMTEVTIVDPHNIKPSKSGATRLGLWVTFDDQFDDAVQLLENPDHVPKRFISMQEMNEIQSSARRKLPGARKGLLKKVAIMIIGVFLLAFIVYIAAGI